MTIFCGLCGHDHPAPAENEDPPSACTSCKRVTRWRSVPLPQPDATGDPGDEDDGWKLEANDFRMLRSYRIAPD